MPDRVQDQLDRARSLIKQKDYAAARSVLKHMDHPTAKRWLAQLDQIAPPEKRRSYPLILKKGGLLTLLCLGLVVVYGVGVTSGIFRGGAANEADDDAQTKEAARSTERVMAGLTATILALTPSSTPTDTATATITLTPSMTFTPQPTSPAILQNTLPPTWTPAASLTPQPTWTLLPTITPRPNTSGSSTRYTTETVNVRSGPGTNYDRLGTLPAGYQLAVLGQDNGWYEIVYGTGTGWLAGQYTTTVAPSALSNGSSGDSPPPIAACNCNGPDLDCSNFSTHAQAQACYNYCMVQRGSDVYRLDGDDNDGRACEALP